MTAHRISAISFRAANLDCTCGAIVRGDHDVDYSHWSRAPIVKARAGTPEALAGAFAEHRRLVGASNANVTAAYGGNSSVRWNGPISEASRPHHTAIGNSRLSPQERGRMGAAAKRAKAAAL